MDPNLLEDFEKKIKALSDQQRLVILNNLYNKEKVCVCDLCDCMNTPQSKLSYHIKILLDAGFISKEPSGTWNYYSVNEEKLLKFFSIEVVEFIKNLQNNKSCICSCNCEEECKCCK